MEEQIKAYLEACGVTYSMLLMGEIIKDDWKCDKWNVILLKGSTSIMFDYHTGLGHRKSKYATPKSVQLNPRSIDAAKWTKEYVLPVQPEIAGVIYSLLVDSEAADQSFDGWCDELSLNADSRKAYKTYELCKDNHYKLAEIFSKEGRAHMGKLLEEY